MLVDGRHIDLDDIDKAVEIVEALPTGFPKRKISAAKIKYDLYENNVRIYHEKGMSVYKAWDESKDQEDLEEALEYFLKAAQIVEKDENFSLYEQDENLDSVYDGIGELYGAILGVIEEKTCFGKQKEADALEQKLQLLRQHAVRMHIVRGGEVVNNAAHRVEQGEVGFSDNEPIGTDNVFSCVCVIVRDPVTHKTALAHIDVATSTASLQNIFDRMPDGNMLEVRLIGAQFGDDVYGQFENISKKNIKKTLEFLEDKNVNVLSASIQDLDQPSAIVVNPKTFEISEEVPGAVNPNTLLGMGRIMVSEGGRSLHIAFDFTSSNERAPVFLSKGGVATLRELYLGRTGYEISQSLKKQERLSNQQTPVATEYAVQLCESYSLSVNKIIGCLDQKIAELSAQGIEISPRDRYSAVIAIEKHSMNLGENADLANQPFVDFIENDLFTVGAEGGYMFDDDGLASVSFPEQSYWAIEVDYDEYGMDEDLECGALLYEPYGYEIG